MEGTYSKRTLGHLNRKRVESVEKPITPSDELSSWLGDDVCAHCSGPARGGQLYCSNDCRQADEQAHISSLKMESVTELAGGGRSNTESTSTFQQRPPSPISESSTNQDQKQNHHCSSSSSQEDRSFRYPCPPSPNLLAQYQTAATTSALTSPALTAFQRSLPQQSRGRSLQLSNPTSSEQSYSQEQRRSSSQSTFSSNSASASDNAYTTDPSTTSPNAGGAVSDEDLEPSDFNLPPSAASASLVLLKSNGGTLRSTSASSVKSPAAPHSQATSSNPSPSSSTSATASGPASIRSPVATFNGAKSSMKYARRPSSTNLQPPVLYSPALAPTSTSKIHAIRVQPTSPNSSKPSSSRSYDAERKLRMGGPMPERQQFRDMRRHSDDATDGKAREQATDSRALDVESVAEIDKRATPMIRSQTERVIEKSPPLGSIASSATKTIHALSPDGSAEVCGRYGCRGSSTRRESLGELVSSLRSSSNSNKALRRASSPKPSSGSPTSDSPSAKVESRPTRHQHTHSATAGLGDLPRLTASAIKALTMTPALDARRTPAPPSPRASQHRGRSPGRRPSHGSANAPDGGEAAERVTPPRGRSKARGPRSTSRRSESPSRVLGASRRRSGSRASGKVSGETLQHTQERAKDSEDSNPPSPFSPKSHPISITRSGRLGSLASGRITAQEAGTSPGGIADDEKDLGISPLALRAYKTSGRSSSRGRRNDLDHGDEGRGRGGRGRDTKVITDSSSERGRATSREEIGLGGNAIAIGRKDHDFGSIEELNEKRTIEVEQDPGFDAVDDIEL